MNQLPHFQTPTFDEYAYGRGICFLGETGTGVTYALLDVINKAIQRKKRLLLIDPYGGLVEGVKGQNCTIAEWNIGKHDEPYYLDLFTGGDPRDYFQVAECIVNLMYLLYDPNHTGILGPRFEHAIRNTVVALLDAKQASFFNIARLLTDEAYLQSILPHIVHKGVLRYFTDQLAKTSDFHKSEVLDYVISKLSMFIEPDSFIGTITTGDNKWAFMHLIKNMKEHVTVNLSHLLSQPQHIQNTVYNTVMDQLVQVMVEGNGLLQNTTILIDEANRFNYTHLNSILTLARKNNVEVIYSVRNLSLCSKEAQYTYLAGRSIIAYRVAPPDAHILAEYFERAETHKKLSSLPNYHWMSRLRTSEGVAMDK